jgi:hypothetical protein
MARSRNPRRPIHRRPEVVAVACLSDPRVQPHPDLERLGKRPLLDDERLLRVERRRHRIRCGAERRMETITRGLDDVTVALLDRIPQDLIMAGQRRAHRLRVLLPQARRALEIGEQERHRPSR